MSDDAIPVNLKVAAWEQAGPPVLVAEAGPAEPPQSLGWESKPDQTFLIGVTRLDASFPVMTYQLTVSIDISLFIGGVGGNPVLVCTDETSGWGSDDIAMDIQSDTGWSRYVSNDEIGDFDQDDARDIWQYIPDVVSYEDGFAVSVIEEDDIDDNDVGTQVIPPFDQVLAWPQWTVIGPDLPYRITGGVTIDVDNGTYTLRCTLARWDPRT